MGTEALRQPKCGETDVLSPTPQGASALPGTQQRRSQTVRDPGIEQGPLAALTRIAHLRARVGRNSDVNAKREVGRKDYQGRS